MIANTACAQSLEKVRSMEAELQSFEKVSNCLDQLTVI